jgi:hypothetical protein
MRRADADAGLLVKLAKGGDGKGAKARLRTSRPGPYGKPFAGERVEMGRDGNEPVAGIAPAAGKDIDVRHEDVLAAAPADEDARTAPGAVEKQDRSGVDGPDSRHAALSPL